MSSQQFLPFVIADARPLMCHELAKVEARLDVIIRAVDAAREIAVWASFHEQLDSVEATLDGDTWRPRAYRDCAKRLRHAASSRDFEDFEIRILRTLADNLDRLAESCFHLQARVEFEYQRSVAA